MTPFEQFIGNLSFGSFNLWVLIKILFVIGFGLYLAFAAIVIRQVKIMSEVVEGLFIWPLRLLARVVARRASRPHRKAESHDPPKPGVAGSSPAAPVSDAVAQRHIRLSG